MSQPIPSDSPDPFILMRNEARITAFALTIVSIVLTAIAFVLYGVATLSPEMTMGLGFFPYLIGVSLQALGVVVFVGALAHLAIASVRDCQARRS